MRKILLLVLSVLTLKVSFGQIDFGLKGGLNLANVGNSGPDNAKTRVGFNAGGLLQIGLTEKLTLRQELLYSVKGFHVPATQSSGKATVSRSYFNLPMLLAYKATEDLTILAGPEPGFLFRAKSKFDGNKFDVSSVYRGWDIGAALGLTYNLTKSLGIDLRYNHGFKYPVDVVYTDQNGNIITQGKVGANRVMQIGLNYLIFK